MKVSELTSSYLADYLKAEEDNLDLYLDAAKAYVKGYVGLDDDAIDEHEDITIAVLAVAADMYDNRNVQVGIQNSYLNKMLQSLLFIHSTNLLPSE